MASRTLAKGKTFKVLENSRGTRTYTKQQAGNWKLTGYSGKTPKRSGRGR